MNKQQKRMDQIVGDFQEYVETYSNQRSWRDYSDTIFIDDMLYGIGIALDRPEHEFANGYDTWRQKLRKHLNPVLGLQRSKENE